MTRIAIVVLALAGLVWFCGFVKLGNEPIAQHLKDYWHSRAVQEEVSRVERWFKPHPAHAPRQEPGREHGKSPRPLAKADDGKPAPLANHEAVDEGKIAKGPKPTAKDNLTDQDRADLNHLIAEKLKQQTAH